MGLRSLPPQVSLEPKTLVYSLAQRVFDVYKRLQRARSAHERTALERQIASADEEIDRLVCELYGLTEEQIAIAEGGVVA